jgi:hypothetical protein
VSKPTVIAACRYDETATEQNGHGALTQGLLDNITRSNPRVSYLRSSTSCATLYRTSSE